MKGVRPPHGRRAAAAALAVLPWLSGCVALPPTGFAVGTDTAPLAHEPAWMETNRSSFGEAATVVCALLEQEVQKNGRTIVARDAPSLTLWVSYPFSLLKNDWGGTLKLSCVADAFGTTVTVSGDGRDSPESVRAIGNEVLGDVATALRRLPRRL